MAKPITIPNTFAAATSAIPLSQLDQDFSTLANSTNDLATYSNYVADTGAANAFIANYPANINTSSLTTGLRLQFKAANANTGASTLNVQVNGASIGTAAIRLTDGSALPANTIVSGAMVDVMYDGTNFQLMNDPSGGQEVITNLTLSGNLTVSGTSNFTGNVTANVANTTTSTITNLSSGNVTITGGTISNVTLDNVTVDVETFSNITINGTASFADGTVSAPSITNTGDTNTGIFFPAADTIAFTEGGVESMRIDSSGNLGLGVTPSAWGSADKAIQVGAYTSLANDGNGSLALTSNAYESATNTWRYIASLGASRYRQNFGDHSWFIAPSGTAGNTITWTQAMTLDSSGNLGIGTSSPSQKLDVRGAIAATDGGTQTTYMSNAGEIELARTAGDAYIDFKTSTAEDFDCRIQQVSDGLRFLTGGNGSSSERMRITSVGRVCIRTTFGTGNEVLAVHFNSGGAVETSQGINLLDTNASANGCSYIVFRKSDEASIGSITRNTNTNAVLYNTTSDYRLKENVTPMTGALGKVSQLNPVTYTWKDNGVAGQGFIAHELQQVIPDAVSGTKDAVDEKGNPVYQGMDASYIVATLTAAIKELNAKVEAQATEIALLKSK